MIILFYSSRQLGNKKKRRSVLHSLVRSRRGIARKKMHANRGRSRRER
jgi:hypothetical protein